MSILKSSFDAVKLNEIVFVFVNMLVGTVITILVVGTFVAVISMEDLFTNPPFKPTIDAVARPLGLVILAYTTLFIRISNFAVSELMIVYPAPLVFTSSDIVVVVDKGSNPGLLKDCDIL